MFLSFQEQIYFLISTGSPVEHVIFRLDHHFHYVLTILIHVIWDFKLPTVHIFQSFWQGFWFLFVSRNSFEHRLGHKIAVEFTKKLVPWNLEIAGVLLF